MKGHTRFRTSAFVDQGPATFLRKGPDDKDFLACGLRVSLSSTQSRRCVAEVPRTKMRMRDHAASTTAVSTDADDGLALPGNRLIRKGCF